MAQECLGCGSGNTFEKCGRVVGGPASGSGSVPYKRLICKDCSWRGEMEEMPDKPEFKKSKE